MATAADYSTGGERLTAQVAQGRYIPLPLYLEPQEAGTRLAQFMTEHHAHSLNVAGNGIYTLHKKGWSPEAVYQWIYECIAAAHALRPIVRIQTGGQTGADMAGAIAAFKLAIPCVVLMPAGFKQRDVRERDFFVPPDELLETIMHTATLLKALTPPPSSPDHTLATVDAKKHF
jgi:hypothetical protein